MTCWCQKRSDGKSAIFHNFHHKHIIETALFLTLHTCMFFCSVMTGSSSSHQGKTPFLSITLNLSFCIFTSAIVLCFTFVLLIFFLFLHFSLLHSPPSLPALYPYFYIHTFHLLLLLHMIRYIHIAFLHLVISLLHTHFILIHSPVTSLTWSSYMCALFNPAGDLSWLILRHGWPKHHRWPPAGSVRACPAHPHFG